jgi:hypothetical protein
MKEYMVSKKWAIIISVIILLGIIVGAIILSTNSGSATGDNIVSSSIMGNFEVSMTSDAVDYSSYISDAIAEWSNIIEDFNVIPITFRVDNTSGNVLAYASMNNRYDIYGGGTVTIGAGIVNPTGGWNKILQHEIGHIVGVGSCSKWDSAIRVDGGGNATLDRSIFVNTGTAYDTLINSGKATGTVGNNIPLSDANDSVADHGSHFDEIVFGDELMTPITDSLMPLTILTINVLKDLGFTVNDSYAESL